MASYGISELIETMRDEADGERGVFYELYGSGIRNALAPLAELLELNLATNPELVELTALSLQGKGGSRLADELRAQIEAKREGRSARPADPAADSEEPKKLWKFQWDVPRMGTVDSTFVATQSEIDGAMGSRVYFGEILGKHSEIYGTLDPEDLEVLSEDQDEIAIFERTVGSTGHCPLDYIEIEE